MEFEVDFEEARRKIIAKEEEVEASYRHMEARLTEAAAKKGLTLQEYRLQLEIESEQRAKGTALPSQSASQNETSGSFHIQFQKEPKHLTVDEFLSLQPEGRREHLRKMIEENPGWMLPAMFGVRLE